ncbi:hypothetical protein [Streptomyces sp. NPDC060031]|uniref:hypothetical protein n=1 Tax=Streptomyces sp. NPDC060031 TaxID=3347043 RepID=UPI0036C33ADD
MIETMEVLNWVSVVRDKDDQFVSITERIPARGDLIMAAPKVLNILMVGPVERAALALLGATVLQPLLVEDALQIAAVAEGVKGHDQAAEDALRHLTGTGLIRRVDSEDGRSVLYNPNVWTQGDEALAKAALKAADARATTDVGALLQEVALNPGLPDAHVKSTERKWVDFAVSQNLVQRSVIQTAEGVERGFLFTPHLRRDPFGGTAGDASGHVRQLVGSMIYAATFAKFKLDTPEIFLRALVNRGVAGNACYGPLRRGMARPCGQPGDGNEP